MKTRTLEEKMRTRIKKSTKVAFILSDFFDLSDRDQVGRVLRKLTQEAVVFKLGQGVYGKSKMSELFGRPVLAKSFPEVAKEALNKLNIKTFPSRAEVAYNAQESTQVPTGLVIGVNKRVSRTLSYNGKSIKYEHVSF